MPKSGEGFIDFIGQVHKTKEQFGQDGPITVHCSAGVGRSGVFITLSIVLERMQYEGVLDVFQTVRILRSQRPAMVQTEVGIALASKPMKESGFIHFFNSHRINTTSAIALHWSTWAHSTIIQTECISQWDCQVHRAKISSTLRSLHTYFELYA